MSRFFEPSETRRFLRLLSPEERVIFLRRISYDEHLCGYMQVRGSRSIACALEDMGVWVYRYAYYIMWRMYPSRHMPSRELVSFVLYPKHWLRLKRELRPPLYDTSKTFHTTPILAKNERVGDARVTFHALARFLEYVPVPPREFAQEFLLSYQSACPIDIPEHYRQLREEIHGTPAMYLEHPGNQIDFVVVKKHNHCAKTIVTVEDRSPDAYT